MSNMPFIKQEPLDREPSVELLGEVPTEPLLTADQSFDNFFMFLNDQIRELPAKLQGKAKREIILMAEEIYSEILAEEAANADRKKMRKQQSS